jgi:small-conductance mechanosensitive channel
MEKLQMEQFWSFNVGQVGQVAVILLGAGMMFQKLKDSIKEHAGRLDAVEKQLINLAAVMTGLARQEERMIAMDQRMLAQGARIDTQAMLLGGRLEAINNIISGHTAQLNNLPHGK